MEEQRIKYSEAAPESYKTMLAFSSHTRGGVLPSSLKELVKIRASQMNGCAFCLDMHVKDARAAGETEERVYMLPAWRESSLYNEKERAALAWAESLTLIAESQAPKELYDEVRKHFNETETIELTHTIVVINAWNRFMIAFRAPAGTYQPKKRIN